MEESCEFCSNEFEHTVVKEFESWEVQLFTNQYYLGRCLVKLKRHEVDLNDLKTGERQELFEDVLPELREALRSLFDPDLYNYTSLRNDCRHFHIHVMPRYSSPRKFEGVEFFDENWNSHYKPYPSDFEIDEEVFDSLMSSISEKMS